ncbi:MAG TPA: gamma-glutamylcyclotransferase family protein [Stellaceae bacterium]|nr:gamma-glutamylcyclotransferase family protein [Stellaceae bacterium]
MRLYFAYGSNMVTRQMAKRCPRARLLGTAVLPDHRFAIAGSGFATIVPRPRARVWGVVWRLAPGDEAALDRYEDVAGGVYRRQHRPVRLDGRPQSALIYVAAARPSGRARLAYLAAILAAAEAFAFPEDYRRELEALLAHAG